MEQDYYGTAADEPLTKLVDNLLVVEAREIPLPSPGLLAGSLRVRYPKVVITARRRLGAEVKGA